MSWAFLLYLFAAPVPATTTAPKAPPTFAADVAPIIERSCISCHATNGAAPFPLTNYRQVRRRSRQIVEVTASGFMPPWLPSRGADHFVGARGLTAAERETLRRWVEAGAPEGEPAPAANAKRARAATRSSDAADLVLTSGEFTVPAEGTGLLRTIVLPLPDNNRRQLRAVEVRATPAVAVHSALLLSDNTGMARTFDEATPEPGYTSMGNIGLNPVGSLGGVLSGKRFEWGGNFASPPAEGDLVVQLHLSPTGKDERTRVSVDLHWSEQPKPRTVTSIPIPAPDIDIAPGNASYTVNADYIAPVDLDIVGLLPVAHYVCREMLVTLKRAGGSGQGRDRETLLQIDDWDLNWQESYMYQSPVRVPKGSRVEFTYTYDNSVGNPRNPYKPPIHVRPGQAPKGEVGMLILYASPVEASDLERVEGSVIENLKRLRRNAKPGE